MISVALGEAATQAVAHHFHRGEGLRVVHPGRPEHANGAQGLAIGLYRGNDHRARGERLDPVLAADRNR